MSHAWKKTNHGHRRFWTCSRCNLVLITSKKPRPTRKYPALLLRGPDATTFLRDEPGHPRLTCEELQVYRVMES